MGVGQIKVLRMVIEEPDNRLAANGASRYFSNP
jgi:hypothetical protein